MHCMVVENEKNVLYFDLEFILHIVYTTTDPIF